MFSFCILVFQEGTLQRTSNAIWTLIHDIHSNYLMYFGKIFFIYLFRMLFYLLDKKFIGQFYKDTPKNKHGSFKKVVQDYQVP